MPFNPFLDNEGDGTWTDLEADSDSDHEASQLYPESSESPSPRLRAQIIELSSDESDAERDGPNESQIALGENEVVGTQDVQEEPEQVEKIIVPEMELEQPDDLENTNILDAFVNGPQKESILQYDSEGSEDEVALAVSDVPSGEVNQREKSYRMRGPNRQRGMRCEHCLRGHKSCDGVRPVCGRCATVQGSPVCRWPSASLTQKEFRRIELAKRAGSTTKSSSLNAGSTASAKTSSSNTTVSTEKFPRSDERKEQHNRNLVYSDVIPDDAPQHSKDLVFSDVLPNARGESGDINNTSIANSTQTTAQGHKGSSGANRGVQYLDLCDSDSNTPTPSRPRNVPTAYTKHPGGQIGPQPKPWDAELIRLKQQGLTCGQIKRRLNLKEAESTVRARYRLLVQAGLVKVEVKPTKAPMKTTTMLTPVYPPPANPQKSMPFACRPCRIANVSCDGQVPCLTCLKQGQGHKCWYRGGRGGGGATAKTPLQERSSTVSVSQL